MGTQLTPVSFDIETTGFAATDEITTVGLAMPLGCRVLLQTSGRTVDGTTIEQEMKRQFDTTIKFTAHDSEAGLLRAFAAYTEEHLTDRNYLLTTYNGESFRRGFDLPFLRTRLALQNETWPFNGLPVTDLMPIYENRFNTTIEESSTATLEGVYDCLVEGELTDCDPFAESSEAVEAFENGNFGPLVKHNIADILRTDALASLAQLFCSKSEFKLKSLTPTANDPDLTP